MGRKADNVPSPSVADHEGNIIFPSWSANLPYAVY